ncbi:MAG: hypothetical protein ABI051_02470 [Vicinamibacterales bacterium]
MKTNVPDKQRGDEAVNSEWVATFTFLDVSGAVTASQWRRVMAPLKTAWRRAISGQIGPR